MARKKIGRSIRKKAGARKKKAGARKKKAGARKQKGTKKAARRTAERKRKTARRKAVRTSSAERRAPSAVWPPEELGFVREDAAAAAPVSIQLERGPLHAGDAIRVLGPDSDFCERVEEGS